MNQLSLAALMAVSLAVTSTIGAEAPTTTNLMAVTAQANPVVARGKGFEISQREMERVIASKIAGNPNTEFPANVEARILTQLIEIHLVLQKATESEKAEARQENDVNFTNIAKTMGAKFERQLAAAGMTADELRLMLFQEAAAQTSLTRQLGIHVTDAEARRYFDQHPGAYDMPTNVHIRELVLLTTADWTRSDAPPLPDEILAAKHKLIFDLHKRILAGQDFAVLARQYNESPLSKDNEDELTFIKDQMDPELGNLVSSLKTNQISDVVTNEGNYCIFQLLKMIPAQKAGFAEVADKIRSTLVGEQKRALGPAYIRKLWSEADVEILDPGLKATIENSQAEVAETEKARARFQAQMAAIAAQITNASPAMTNALIPKPNASTKK